MAIVRLCDMIPGQEAEFFALLSGKEELTTREGKPYWRVSFRDSEREVTFPIWDNSPWAADCRDKWPLGAFFKIRASVRETNYGPQLDIRRIREVTDADSKDGFEPTMCLPHSRFDPRRMWDDLVALAKKRIERKPLAELVMKILDANRETLLRLPAARRNHHAFVAGWLEHTLSVTRTCVFLADKYAEYYPELDPPLDKSMAVAGAILHDIGKLRELEQQPGGTVYTPDGELVGHMLLGRDIVLEAAAGIEIDADTLLRLGHLILSHQRLPEWGSPKPPMTPEALLVHYCDDIDAKYGIMVQILRDDKNLGPVTSDKNLLRQKFYRGPEEG